MTRRQLGDALRTLLRETHYDMERSAEMLIRMHVAGPAFVAAEESGRADSPEARCRSVLADVAVQHRTTVDKLKAIGGRAKPLVVIRHEAAWRCRQITPRPSYPEIARAMGHKHHTSVIYAVQRHERRLAAEAEKSA